MTLTAEEIDRLARIVWDYHHLDQPLERSDLLLVLGSHDTRVAERAAELFLEGWAPLILFCGGRGRLTEAWDETEARVFARVARDMGVPEERILLEEGSTNTGENVVNARALLERRGFHPRRVLAVQKPYMERRAYATVRKQWPEVEVTVTSPRIAFEEYPNAGITKEEVIAIMLGDLQRIPIYAERGFQSPQDVPPEVWEAYETLVSAGFTSHLIE
jgi:uncharacterized SAM-binding protein YcdF (DUF218 family)